MSQVFLDPTFERDPLRRPVARRRASLDGAVTLLDISKPNSGFFLARIGERLAEAFAGLALVQRTKPTYARNAPLELREEIRRTSIAVIEALAD